MGFRTAAITWEFQRRPIIALAAFAAYMLIVGLARSIIVGTPETPIQLDPPDGRAALIIAPFSITFMYFLAVFSFGLSGDLAGRPSIFPQRLFALPVPTAALAGWPLLYGTASMVSLWLLTAGFARLLWGVEVPVIWPAVLAAAFLAWTQVFTWMSYGLPGLRVIVTVLWLAALDAIVIVAFYLEVAELVLVAFLAPQVPLAYLAARAVVARARRGEVADWRHPFTRLPRIAEAWPRRRSHFRSAGHAQAWFEWRRHGRSLPSLVAMVIPFELALIFFPGNGSPRFVFYTLVAVLITPPLMAGFVASSVSKANPYARDYLGLTPFMATRPISSAAFVAARLRMALRSVLAAWLVVAVAIPVALAMSGTWPAFSAELSEFIDYVGTPRSIAIALLVAWVLVSSTWKRTMQSLYIGLTGRDWLIKANVLLTLAFAVVILPLLEWIDRSRAVQGAIWDALPWVPPLLVVTKMSLAAWIVTRLQASRVLSDRALVIAAACWTATVLVLYAALAWLMDTPFIPRYLIASIAILQVPLVRLAAAPLAFAWNRHR